MKKEIIKIYKFGKFYNAYGDHGYIIHELLGYKFIEAKQSIGFPASALSKVENILVENNLSYEIIEDGKIIKIYEGINKNYNKILKQALENIKIEERINRLREKVNNLSCEELEHIIGLLENGTYK